MTDKKQWYGKANVQLMDVGDYLLYPSGYYERIKAKWKGKNSKGQPLQCFEMSNGLKRFYNLLDQHKKPIEVFYTNVYPKNKTFFGTKLKDNKIETER